MRTMDPSGVYPRRVGLGECRRKAPRGRLAPRCTQDTPAAGGGRGPCAAELTGERAELAVESDAGLHLVLGVRSWAS